MYQKSLFTELIEIINDGLNAKITLKQIEADKFVIDETDNISNEENFTQINFRFEKNILIIPWFYLRKPKQGIGSRIIEWFINFCLENDISAIEIRGVGKDKAVMQHLMNKYNFSPNKVSEEDYKDYKRIVTSQV